MLTFKTRAKRYPAWHFVVAGVLSIGGLALQGWLAYRYLGLDERLARQAVMAISIVCLVFLPLLYRSYQVRFRDRTPMTVVKTVAVFLTALFVVLLYYIERSGVLGADSTPRRVTIAVLLIAFTAGMLFFVYGVKYEVD